MLEPQKIQLELSDKVEELSELNISEEYFNELTTILSHQYFYDFECVTKANSERIEDLL